jgi:hypothetical protein
MLMCPKNQKSNWKTLLIIKLLALPPNKTFYIYENTLLEPITQAACPPNSSCPASLQKGLPFTVPSNALS